MKMIWFCYCVRFGKLNVSGARTFRRKHVKLSNANPVCSYNLVSSLYPHLARCALSFKSKKRELPLEWLSSFRHLIGTSAGIRKGRAHRGPSHGGHPANSRQTDPRFPSFSFVGLFYSHFICRSNANALHHTRRNYILPSSSYFKLNDI